MNSIVGTNKNSSIEIIRLLATFGVVFDHVGVCWIHYYEQTATIVDKIVYYSLVACCHWPVPVFMAITGALLLSKEKIGYVQVGKYFKKIAVLVIVFGTIFAWMELYFNTHQLNEDLFWQGFLNMLAGKSWKHLWYLYMLLGVYLVLPIISICKNVSIMEGYYILVDLCAFYFFFTYLGSERMFCAISASFYLYFLFGNGLCVNEG